MYSQDKRALEIIKGIFGNSVNVAKSKLRLQSQLVDGQRENSFDVTKNTNKTALDRSLDQADVFVITGKKLSYVFSPLMPANSAAGTGMASLGSLVNPVGYDRTPFPSTTPIAESDGISGLYYGDLTLKVAEKVYFEREDFSKCIYSEQVGTVATRSSETYQNVPIAPMLIGSESIELSIKNAVRTPNYKSADNLSQESLGLFALIEFEGFLVRGGAAIAKAVALENRQIKM